MKTSARLPPLIKILPPFRQYDSPSSDSVAVVVISVAAEPASGSVMAIAHRMRPSQIGRSHFSCCSGVPSTHRWLAVPVPLVCISPALRGSYLAIRSEEHTSELQSHSDLVCRLLLEKKKKTQQAIILN